MVETRFQIPSGYMASWGFFSLSIQYSCGGKSFLLRIDLKDF